MLGELPYFDFQLALDLGMTLAQVRSLPNYEFTEWQAFYKVRNEMEKLHGGSS